MAGNSDSRHSVYFASLEALLRFLFPLRRLNSDGEIKCRQSKPDNRWFD